MTRLCLLALCAALGCSGCLSKPARPDAETYLKIVQNPSAASPETLAKAATKLGEMGEAKAVTPLTALLRNPDSNVRNQTALSLGLLRGYSAAPQLSAALLNENTSSVRVMMAWAVGELGGEAERQTLSSLLSMEKAKGAFNGPGALDKRYVAALEAAMKRIDARRSGKQ
ncbi:MAG TPA: HEAT repeat domain-containing protein [Elusimicrobiales bacterium]|nr:HEAT repeat domain-containing protein [Elusimicrobiales bacterium]